MAKGYTAKDIDVLEGLEPVRKRPGMFIGSTDKEHADSVRRKFASDFFYVFPLFTSERQTHIVFEVVGVH